jgi:N-acetylglucosamine-6-phosphate deacetylase
MLGEAQAPGDVLEILAAHRRLGTGAILPTLISDTPETTERVIHLVATARQADPASSASTSKAPISPPRRP